MQLMGRMSLASRDAQWTLFRFAPPATPFSSSARANVGMSLRLGRDRVSPCGTAPSPWRSPGMKDYDLGETRVGTSCTFTGGGATEKKSRVNPQLVGSVFGALFVIAVGTGYFLVQVPQSALPPLPTPSMPAFPPSPEVTPIPASQPTLPPPIPFGLPGSPGAPQTERPVPRAAQASASGISTKAVAPTAKSPQPRAAAKTNASPAVTLLTGRFHVQTGAFASRDNALSLLGRLRDRGYAATMKDGQVFRVWVGGYLDRTTAKRLAENLEADGFQATLTPR